MKQCPELYKINLENNNIRTLAKLKCLAGHKITKIYLFGNPVATNANYKNELFDLIPTLKAIDGTDKNGEEVESTIYTEEEDEEKEYESSDDEDGDKDGEENKNNISRKDIEKKKR